MTYPVATDPVSAFTRADGTTEAHSVDHGRVIEMWENVLHHGAKGDGSTDDTTAFTAAATAAGQGGTVFVPPGRTYILTDWTPAHTLHLVGGGRTANTTSAGSAILKASSTATWVVKFLPATETWYSASIENLQIDGNSTANGVTVCSGSDAHGAQGTYFRDVEFFDCLIGTKLDNNTATQNDKVLFDKCDWISNTTTGLWLNTANADETLMIGGNITGAATGVRVSGGSLTWIGGQTGNLNSGAGTSILVDGANVSSITLIDFVDEVIAHSIDASADMPSGGITAIGCVFQGTTDTVNLSAGVFQAQSCTFNTDIIGGTNSVFIDTGCYFPSPAAWSPTAAAAAQRFSTFPRVASTRQSTITHTGGTNGDQVAYQYSSTAGGGTAGDLKPGLTFRADTNLYRDAANSLVTDDTFTAKSGIIAQSAALSTSATTGFLYIPTCAGTPTGTPTSQTGTVPLVYDTTNHKLYVYDGGWKGGTNPGAFS